jgi:ribosomal protein L12E/L44/L45/RPP1/RPP2
LLVSDLPDASVDELVEGAGFEVLGVGAGAGAGAWAKAGTAAVTRAAAMAAVRRDFM